MNNFNYNNYIGEHMVEPLEVFIKSEHRSLALVGIVKDRIYLQDDIPRVYGIKDCIPKIKSISDLTDDDWLFVFGGNDTNNKYIDRNENQINFYMKSSLGSHFGNCIFLSTNKINNADQQTLNRLYSLHVSLDYEELIKNNKAVRKIT